MPYRGAPIKKDYGFRINGEIRVPEVRLVGENLHELVIDNEPPIEPGVYPTRQALRWAELLNLDLVEISPNADPPVCRIIDVNKYLFQKEKKEKELKAKAIKAEVKEIRFGPNTDDHDFEFKVRHARNFLQEGSKVRAYVFFKGRSVVFKDRGELLLLKFIKELEDIAATEALPKLEGKKMFILLAPRKGTVKK
ncbi:MAG TPA: translation initiation factor IF-3 [Saprospiraceae bacterium]|nr:translation initiation factor IF-3 [Saprospiraceae bacterium]HNT19815.1 translation initiation factor IF-3 [Saprospiraceae bacterium]